MTEWPVRRNPVQFPLPPPPEVELNRCAFFEFVVHSHGDILFERGLGVGAFQTFSRIATYTAPVSGMNLEIRQPVSSRMNAISVRDT